MKAPLNKRRLLNLLALGAGVAVLAGTFWQIGWGTVLGHVGSVGLGFLVLIGLAILCSSLDVWSLQIALGGGVGLGRLLGISLAGSAVNQFTPLGEGGEVVKGNMLLEHVSGQRTVSALLAWNLAHRASKHVLIFLGPLLILLVDPDRFGGWMLVLFLVAAVVAAIPTALLFLLARSRGSERVLRVLERIPGVRRVVSERLLVRARQTDVLLREFTTTRRRDAWKMFWIQLAGKFVILVDYWAVQQMLGVHVSLVEASFLVSGAQVLAVVLSISPVQIGVVEGGETAMWALLGLPVDIGFAQALVRRLRNLLFHLAGLVYLGAEGLRRPAARADAAPSEPAPRPPVSSQGPGDNP